MLVVGPSAVLVVISALRLLLSFDARILVYTASLLVFVEDRLCSGIIYPKLIGCTPNRVGLQNKFKKLLAPLVANVIVRALTTLSLQYNFRRLLIGLRLFSLKCYTFLIH